MEDLREKVGVEFKKKASSEIKLGGM